ncbi:MAG: DUF4349 domain-containing protein [Candidatus Omnitrophica bacterium]|nr:DUF4349 domain-containing protein [Candidatus Omnitrophota bacterium]
MMFRRHIKEELSGYLDGQLTQQQRKKVEAHLKECDACAKELERLKMLSAQLNMWKAPALDESFDSSVKAEIVRRELERGQVKMKKRTLAIMIPSGVLAGILLLVCLNVAVKRGMPDKLAQVTGVTTDEISDQYTPGFTTKATRHYEPYYRQEYMTTTASTANQKSVSSINGRKDDKYYAVSNEQCKVSQDYSGGSSRGSSGQAFTSKVYAPALPAAQEKVCEPAQGTVIVIQPSLPATGVGEYIIRTGVVKLEVEDGKETYGAASRICQELGGYMAASSFYEDKEGRQAGTLTMRIPKDKFTAALDRLSVLGKVENISTGSQDVSQEYSNLKAKLDAEMIVYNKVLEALQKRQNTIPEAMRLESELTPILRQVEYLKNRIEALNNAVSFTTVTVNFHESAVSVKALNDSKHFIQDSMVAAGIKSVKFVAAALPVAILGAVLLIIAVITVMVIRFLFIRLSKRE